MTERDKVHKPAPLPAGDEFFFKSIFPTFNVNVPMPADTAVPGSYNKPAQQSPSGSGVSKPAKVVE